MMYENVGFELDVGVSSTVLGHCFVRRVGMRSAVQTLMTFHISGPSEFDIGS